MPKCSWRGPPTTLALDTLNTEIEVTRPGFDQGGDLLLTRASRYQRRIHLEPELLLCEKVAVLQASCYRHADLVRMLGETPAALRIAEVRVKAAAERLKAE